MTPRLPMPVRSLDILAWNDQVDVILPDESSSSDSEADGSVTRIPSGKQDLWSTTQVAGGQNTADLSQNTAESGKQEL